MKMEISEITDATQQTIRVASLGDLHWGAMDPEVLEHELEEVFMAKLIEEPVHVIIQMGDYFDKRLSLDSEHAKVAMRFTIRLAQFAEENGILLRILKGGIAHDFFQLQNYLPLELEYPHLRVISNAQHEELFPGMDVLWLPEEYPTDYSDYYGQFLFDEEGNALIYDAIFMHGEIDVAARWSEACESERHYGGTPCHSAEMLMSHCSGPIWSGHIHTMFRYKKRLGYPGSFTRWAQGEETEKGFDILTLDYKGDKGWNVDVERVENYLAPVFKTVSAGEILGIASTPDEIVAIVRETAASCFKLRVKMLDYPIGIEELSLVRGSLLDNPNIEIVTSARAVGESVVNESVEADGEEAVQEARSERLSYLRDHNLSGEERLLRYLHETHPDREDITLDSVLELTAPLS